MVQPVAIAVFVLIVLWLAVFALVMRANRNRSHWIDARDLKTFQHLHPAPKSNPLGRALVVIVFSSVLLIFNLPKPHRLLFMLILASLPPVVVLIKYVVAMRTSKGVMLQFQVVDLIEQGDLSQAHQVAREALELYGPTAYNLNALGIVLLRLKQWDEALRTFEQAIRTKPKEPNVRTLLGANRAYALLKVGRAEEGLVLMPDAIATFPTEVIFRANYCEMLAAVGRLEEARDQYAIVEELMDVTKFRTEAGREIFETRIAECRDALARAELRATPRAHGS
ncbi:MAG: tetratricopeptide repeat protein [Planctomycetaceae bacterium]|nr:tetratricopeptide repeat protein [Planctomycetaceae bacterium]